MATKICIFNPVSNLIDITTGIDGVAVPSAGAASAGQPVVLNASGLLDPSLFSASGSTFAQMATGTNTTATMTVGTGASLVVSGTGVVEATKIQSVVISGTPPTLGQILTAQSTTTANWQTPAPTAINPQTGTNYPAVLSDANQIVTMANAASNTFTIPTNASVAFPVGTSLSVIQAGAGTTTLAPAGGVTINTPSSLTTRTQWSTVAVVQIAANVWVAGGDLT